MKKKESALSSLVADLLTLAHLHGLKVDDAYSYDGDTVVSGLKSLLTSFGVPCTDAEEIHSAMQRKLMQVLAPVCAIRQSASAQTSISVTVPSSLKSLHWSLTEESGFKQEGEWLLDASEARRIFALAKQPHYLEYRLPLPENLPPGYHSLVVTARDSSFSAHVRTSDEGDVPHDPINDLFVIGDKLPANTELFGDCLLVRSTLVVSPNTAYIPESVKETNSRYWGVQIRLAAVSSNRNWGVGDLSDLRELVSWFCDQGAGFILLDALQSALVEDGGQILSASRTYINPIYIDVESVEDYQESDQVQRLVLSPQFQDKLAAFRKETVTRNAEVLAEKMRILAALYQHFRQEHILKNTERAQAFRRFQLAGGHKLDAFGLFSAIADQYQDETHGQSGQQNWRGFANWPESLKQPQSASVREFRAKNRERIEFFQYLQWIADAQLQASGNLCFQRHVPVGLGTTLPVGYTAGGADVWFDPDLFAQISLSEGEDQHFQLAESHGYPIIPERLLSRSCQPFIDTLRHHMRCAGAVNIERAFEFQTFEWSAAEKDSLRISYSPQLQEILSCITTLESHKQRCMIIDRHDYVLPVLSGKGQGEKYCQSGFFMHREWCMEKDELGAYKPIDSIPAASLLTFGSSRIPSLSAFWLGHDLSTVKSNTAYEKEKRHRIVEERVLERAALLRLLENNALLPEGFTTDPATITQIAEPFVSSVYCALAKTDAQLVAFALDDVAGMASTSGSPSSVEAAIASRHIVALNDYGSEKRVQAVINCLVGERGAASQQAPAPESEGEPAARATVVPNATYRLQFNKEFTLRQGLELIPYLAKLGVSHCYASPLLKARPGSMHGYDIINHKELNPEIGTYADLEDFVGELRRHNMGLILDIVPNHMGIGQDNAWWVDVLENGPASLYVDYFDIDWQPVKDELRGKVLLPILGEPYGSVLRGGQLKLEFAAERGALSLRYFEHLVPLNPVSYPTVLGTRLQVLKERLGADHEDVLEYLSILSAFQHLPNHLEPVGFSERIREKKTQMKRLAALSAKNSEIRQFIEQNLSEFEVKADNAAILQRMHNLLEAQAYRLAHWRVSSDEINYRRFFDVDSLAAIRAEDPRVFAEMHELVVRLIGERKVDGLRIDHPDGLYDPADYFLQLQMAAADQLQTKFDRECPDFRANELPIYLVVEKILAPFEHLEQNWAVHGTVGYDFLNSVNELMVCSESEEAFNAIYEQVLGRRIDYDELKRRCKHIILDNVLNSELNVLAHRLSKIAESSWFFRDFTLNSLRQALREVLSGFPVYRTYVSPGQVDKVARQYIDWAVGLAKRHSTALHANIYDFVRQVLTMELADKASEFSSEGDPEKFKQAVEVFAMKFQQFTSPVMAKSVEDTLFYRYNRFVGLNEVGGEPQKFGGTVSAFHHQNQQRQLKRPDELLSTSTHDTKRSEDVRARLAVLSEIPDLWQQRVLAWTRVNRSRKTQIDDEAQPDANDEYLIYQTIVGACPLTVSKKFDWKSFSSRVEQYVLKAAREGKEHTSWINQNQAYENALVGFVQKILTATPTNAFLDDFVDFHTVVSRLGLFNSLTQTLLKLTVPGVPDIYQGCELWDFSLVDPDNRRPVDYQLRRSCLGRLLPTMEKQSDYEPEDVAKRKSVVAEGLADWPSGLCKQLILSAALKFRAGHQDLFKKGQYLPLEVEGPMAKHVIAFARVHGQESIIVVAPLMVAKALFAEGAGNPFDLNSVSLLMSADWWQDTAVILPEESNFNDLRDLFTLQTHKILDSRLNLSAIFQEFPVGLLAGSHAARSW